jgi:hypothetical protein
MWWFEASHRRATPKGQPSSPAQHHVRKSLPTNRTPFHVRGTRRFSNSASYSHLPCHADVIYDTELRRLDDPGGLCRRDATLDQFRLTLAKRCTWQCGACVGSAVVVDGDRRGGGMGLTRQYEVGLKFGCVKCKILRHRYCSCCDPGFASATRAAKTGIRRIDVVF